MTEDKCTRYSTTNGVCRKISIEPFNVEIGQRIRTYRKCANISQKELGKAMDVTAQQIHKYEIGANDISYKNLCLIAMALNIPVDYLTDGIIFLFNKENNPQVQSYQGNENIKYLIEISRYLGNLKDNQKKKKIIDLIKSVD